MEMLHAVLSGLLWVLVCHFFLFLPLASSVLWIWLVASMGFCLVLVVSLQPQLAPAFMDVELL